MLEPPASSAGRVHRPWQRTRKTGGDPDIELRNPFARGWGYAMDKQHEVTRLLVAWRSGADGAEDELFAIVYEELRRIARHHLRRERAEHTFGATALVHEAYLRLVDQTRVEWADRAQFFAIASRTMRRVLVDHARRHRAAKRDGARVRVSLGAAPPESIVADERAATLLAVDDALTRLVRAGRATRTRRRVSLLRWTHRIRDERGAGRHRAHDPA